jgi:hypothetical protein
MKAGSMKNAETGHQDNVKDSGKIRQSTSALYKIVLSEKEKRVILVSVAIIMLILAILVSISGSSGKSPLEQCESIILAQPRYGCITNIANSTGNATMCTYINDQQARDSCIYEVAMKDSNMSLCSQINLTDSLRNACLYNIALQSHSAKGCMALQAPYNSSCLYSYANETGFSNESICKLIANSTASQNCSYMHYYKAAFCSI